MKWFQIKLVHRISATNVVLMHMGIENNITCSFCRKEWGSINHIFWLCTYVRSFWERFQIVVNAGCPNATSVLFIKTLYCLVTTSILNQISPFIWLFSKQSSLVMNVKISKTIPQLRLFNRYLQTNFEVYEHNAKLKMSHCHVQKGVTRLHWGCSSYTDPHVQPRPHQIILTH